MTEPLMIFGKPFGEPSGGTRKASVGLFVFRIYKWSDGWTGNANAALMPDSEPFDTAELCVAWLESEARRIMRECFEIAGPMDAVKEFCYDNGGACYAQVTPVRFRDK